MSTYLNCILQKKNKETKEWETVLTNVFSGYYHELYEFLSGDWGAYDGIAHEGLPEGLQDTKELGEWGYGWCTLKEFCEAKTSPEPKISDRFEVEHHKSGYTVTFKEQEEVDYHYCIRAYQIGLRAFFDTSSEGMEWGETYRLVFGYS